MPRRLFQDSGLTGKVAIVTGGSRGIGRSIVEHLAAEGADVTLLFLQSSAAADEVVAGGRRRGERIAAERVDVRDPDACKAAVARIRKRCGPVDLLVNNSGVVRDALLGMMGHDSLRTVLDTNVGGVFNVTRAVVAEMISRRSGKIINVSSVAAEKGGRGQTSYAASKGAINAMTRALAVELAPRGITVNAVAPGVIETEMSADIRERAPDQVKSRILLRRFGQPDEVAAAVVFLASRYADYITGEVLHVDGGFKME